MRARTATEPLKSSLMKAFACTIENLMACKGFR